MNSDPFKLSPPWTLLREKFKALFGRDKEITVEYDDARKRITLRVDSQRKTAALDRLLPITYTFGNVTVNVCVVPGNRVGPLLPEDATIQQVLEAAFDGNPVVTQIRQVSKGLFRGLCYCVFEKKVVQYYADNLCDINGNNSTLMECVARELLTGATGVYFCTSAENEIGDAGLGVWP